MNKTKDEQRKSPTVHNFFIEGFCSKSGKNRIQSCDLNIFVLSTAKFLRPVLVKNIDSLTVLHTIRKSAYNWLKDNIVKLIILTYSIYFLRNI